MFLCTFSNAKIFQSVPIIGANIFTHFRPHEKNYTNQTFQKLASLGIIGDQLRTALKLLGSSQHYRIEGFKGALNWASIMSIEDSFSDSGCNFWQSGRLRGFFNVLFRGISSNIFRLSTGITICEYIYIYLQIYIYIYISS